MKTLETIKKQNLINGVISLFLVMIYSGLIIFGIISLLSPDWLKNLSVKGRVSEAITMQNYGDYFLNRQEYEMAISQYKKAIAINPEMAEAYVNLGVALKQSNDYENALAAFNKALEFENVMHDATYYNMAVIFQEQNKPEQAIQHFLKSASTAPFPVFSYQRAGELLNNMGRWNQAFETFNHAIENLFTMQNCYTGMLKRDYNLFDDENVKQKIKLLLDKGIENIDLSSYDEKAFNDALTRDPNLAGIYNQYGYTYAMNGNFEKAIEYFNLALQIKPDFQNARSNLNAAWNQLNAQGSQK